MRYFHVSNGLRGCFMPDNGFIYAVKTRRQLGEILASEAKQFADDGYAGASKKKVTSWIAESWRSKSVYDVVLPLRQDRGESYSYGLFCSPATKEDWQAQEESEL